jgi:hypothetical protein
MDDLTQSKWPERARDALADARGLAEDVIVCLGCRALNAAELDAYRRAEKLLETLDTPC